MLIAGGLVTYNRLELLKRAVAAAIDQSRPLEKLLVINNASTDGTRDYLEGLNHPAILPINLEKNLGGAGGFAMAIDLATRLGFEAIWVFDDDGVPDRGAVAALERGLEDHQLDMAGSLVSAEDDDAHLAFGLICERPGYTGPSLWTVAEAQAAADGGVLRDMANPFNGTLIRLSAIADAGNIRPEMFLWGDEVELMRRLIRTGRKVGTVVDARHRHPRPKSAMTPTPLGPVRVPPAGREVFFYRNLAYNLSRHRGWRRSVTQMMRFMAQHASIGSFRQSLKIPLWWTDGLLDSYRMAPSRKTLVHGWRHERERIVRQLGCS